MAALTLFSSLSHIRGIGEAVLSHFKLVLRPIGGEFAPLMVRDLLFHRPVNLVDRRRVTPVSEAVVGAEQVFQVKVLQHVASAPHHIAKRRKLPYRVITQDETGELTLTFFHANPTYLERSLPVGAERLIAGKPSIYDRQMNIGHPSVIAGLDKKAEILRIQPVYPATAKLGSKAIARYVREALVHVIAPKEWIPEKYLKAHTWPSMLDALKALHMPATLDALNWDQPHRIRLAFDELMAHQCMLQMLRKHNITTNKHIIARDTAGLDALLQALPFTLTKDQRASLNDMLADMAGSKPMARMIQGDVGCGKTIVAFLAMASVARSGKQALLMAPTDLLARQHMESLKPLADGLGISIVLLTGKLGAREKKAAHAAIASGSASLAIGTHALFQDDVSFKDLALTVIDEQHRFGVNQRKRLTEKGLQPHMLHMSATPIPRSLTMTFYGDLDISLIKERPPGRLPIATRAMPLSKVDELVDGLHRVFEKNERAYWVCPLITPDLDIDESEEEAFSAAQVRFDILSKKFPGKVGLVHGQMPVKEREETMRKYVSGELSLLVATTVIEVGVNVPEATVMIIEQAERFGLAQLHQLRGRVGRSHHASHCVLLYGERLSEVAKERLKIIRDEQDGFVLAEEDLRLRGSGDLLGTKQTGLPEFIFADIGYDQQLLRLARDEATRLLKDDPQLQSAEGRAIGEALRLFGYDEHYARSHAA